jgi:hypothetical protein
LGSIFSVIDQVPDNASTNLLISAFACGEDGVTAPEDCADAMLLNARRTTRGSVFDMISSKHHVRSNSADSIADKPQSGVIGLLEVKLVMLPKCLLLKNPHYTHLTMGELCD